MAQRQNVQVNLQFTADTGKARAQLQELQTSLQKLIVSSAQQSNFGINKELQEASKSAAQLQYQLEKATNVQTGKLDLGKFSESLKQSGKTLKQYQQDLSKLGAAGDAAFEQLAQSVMSAEMPLKRTNKTLDEFWANLKKTAGWTISSSIINNFQGALQKAYGYAQDLNKSLNDIRIVTGYSTDQMAEFAKNANTAAKALSTTTTNYTNASLIYYQQGLTDQEVIDRTNVTVKMANAAGVSAEEVSQQLTAVWNNFYDGSKSLEYYADVMTALGAATASSTDEISEGLEKFASVADTIGLSYEYATASLATITATTRESANVVGTALKTLFSRIQGLSLGETLDDGTDLNKYSDALNKVGISIFDQNHQLKEMDDILDEMGNKWDTLAQDQKMALAQTVAGVRQYTQLITLMDNWDYFQENLGVATGATGALDTQADIYAESWEAANKRIQASAESIYDALLNDEFFIKLTNFGADVLDTIKEIIDSMGGVEGVLLTVGAVATRIFNKQIAQSLRDTAYQIKYLTGAADKDAIDTKRDAGKLVAGLYDTGGDSESYGANAINSAEKSRLQAQLIYLDKAKELNEEERRIAEFIFDQQQSSLTTAKNIDEQVESEEAKLRVYQEELRLSHQIEQSRDKTQYNASQQILDDFMTGDYDHLMSTNSIAEFQSFKQLMEDGGILSVFETDESIINSFKEFSNLLNLSGAEDNVEEVRLAYEKLYKTLQTSIGSETLNYSQFMMDNGLTSQARDFQDKKKQNRIASTISSRMASRKKQGDFGETDKNQIELYIKQLKDLSQVSDKVKNEIQQVEEALSKGDYSAVNTSLTTLITKLQDSGQAFDELEKEAEEARKTIVAVLSSKGFNEAEINEMLNTMAKSADTVGIKVGQLWTKTADAEAAKEGISNLRHTAKADLADLATSFTSLGFSIGSTTTSIFSLVESFRDGQPTVEDFMSVLMVGGQITETVGSLKGAHKTLTTFAGSLGKTGMAAKVAGMSLGAFTGYAAAAVAVIAGLVIAFKAIYNNSPEGKLKAATESAQLASQEADRLSQAYKEVNSQLDALEDKTKSIEEMTRGTYEWRSAIMETNEEVIQLLQSYDLLKEGMYEINADGLYSITKAGEEEIDRIAFERQQQAINNKYASKLALNEAKLNSEFSENQLVRAIGFGSNEFGKELKSALIAGTLEANNDSLEQFLVNQNILRTSETDYGRYDSLGEYALFANTRLEDLPNAIEDLIQVIKDTEKDNAIILKEIGQNLYGEKINNNTNFDNDEKELLKQYAGEAYQAAIDEKIDEKDYQAYTNRQLANEYLKANNLSSFRKDSKGKYTFIDSAGNETTLNVEQIKQELAAADLNKDAIYAEVEAEFKKIVEIAGDIGDGVSTALMSAKNGLGIDLSGVSRSDYSNSDFTDKIINSIVNDLGYTDEETAKQWVEAAKAAEEKKIQEIVNNSPNYSAGFIHGDAFFRNISGKTLTQEQQLLDQVAFDNFDSLSSFKTEINNIQNAIKDTKTFENFIDVLSTIDKENLTVDKLTEALGQSGFYAAEFGLDLTNLVEILSKAGIQTIQDYQSINNIVNSIKEKGTLTQEDFDKITQLIPTTSSFLTLMGDGLYHLTGDAKEFYDLIKGQTDNIPSAVQDLSNDYKDLVQGNLTIVDKINALETVGMINSQQAAEYKFSSGTSATATEVNKLWTPEILEQAVNNKITEIMNYMTLGLEAYSGLDLTLFNESTQKQFRKIAIEAELLNENLDITTDSYDILRKNIVKLNPELDENSEIIDKIIIASFKAQEGVKQLQDNWDNWKKILQSNNEIEKALILPDINKTLANALGLDEATYSMIDEQAKGFANTYADLISQALTGDTEAVEKLKTTAHTLSLEAKVGIVPTTDKERFEQAKNQIFDFLTSLPDGQAIELTIDQDGKFVTAMNGISSGFADMLNEMLKNSTITMDELNRILNRISVEYEVEYEEIPLPNIEQLSSDAGKRNHNKIFGEEKTLKIVKSIKPKEFSYTSPISDWTNTNWENDSGNGSSSAPSDYKSTSKDDVIERYKEQDDVLDNIGDALKKANREADNMYGANRLKQLDKVGKALWDEAEAIEAKKKKAEEYLAVDKEMMKNTAEEMGIDLNIDEATGDILNYTAILENLYDELAAAQAQAQPGNFSTKEAQDAFIESSVQPIETKIEQLKAVIAQYEETRELIEDLTEEYEAKIDEWKANNYEKLSYVLEIKLDINDMDLQEIEYDIKALGDNFYKMAEAAALISGDKLAAFNDQLQIQDTHVEELEKAYRQGAITQADYVEGLQNAYDATMDLANSVLDLDQEMMEYYSNTLDKANEELDKYTNNLEHLTGILDHYKNIMGIIGKETDYEAMGKIIDARVITTRNELDVAKKNYAMMAEEVDKWVAKMTEATGEKELELYTKNWEAANEKMQEAQDEMLSKTEAWAEAMREQIENALSLENRNLEKILTGEFDNFDSLISSMDRAQSLQDNYLTETNKIYELDKLVNKAQQEIDKTNNQIAKQKLKAYIDETESLEDVNQLSKYNLEIQQAKLDLVMAEIALEEAQNAKSVVRLSRDSEGNYGYVYTADQNKISQAEQDFADAQNKLYNIGLRGSTEFAEKYVQTLQEMYDTLGQLQERFLNGEFESEEQYNQEVIQIKKDYFNLLKSFQDDYTRSFTTHDEVRTESWGTSYETMINSTQEWEDAVNQNIENVSDQFSLWEELSTEASENIEDGLDEVTESSETLAKQIKDEILPAIEDEIDLVGDLTVEYAELRDELVGAASDYLKLAEAIRKKIEAETGSVDYDSINYNEGKPESPSPDSGSGEGSTGGNGGATPKAEETAMRIAELIDKVHKGSITQDSSGWTNNAKTAGYSAEEISIARQIFTTSKTGDDGKTYNYRKALEILKAQGFDTGGYTGVWGSDGRWALLHQKELVLNQDDTSNILSAVGIIRHIIDSIDLQSAYQRLAAPSASFFGAVSGGQAIDQNVSIEATFPNVQDRHEIEEAFNNLINTASQYAFRK